MKFCRTSLAILAAGAAGYIAGSFTLGSRFDSVAQARDAETLAAANALIAASVAQPADMEVSPEMKAMMAAGIPGPNHRILDTMIGTWNADVRFWMEPNATPMEASGPVTREWILNGHYIKEDVSATMEMGEFHGLGLVGYNNIDGQYEIVWADSESTGFMWETGTYDADRKVLTTRGNHRDPATGKVVVQWGELNLANADHQTATGWMVGPDGKPFKHFEGDFVRAKK